MGWAVLVWSRSVLICRSWGPLFLAPGLSCVRIRGWWRIVCLAQDKTSQLFERASGISESRLFSSMDTAGPLFLFCLDRANPRRSYNPGSWMLDPPCLMCGIQDKKRTQTARKGYSWLQSVLSGSVLRADAKEEVEVSDVVTCPTTMCPWLASTFMGGLRTKRARRALLPAIV